MAMKQISKSGYDKLKEELDYLVGVKRAEMAQKLKEARAQGDLSENAEYDEAKTYFQKSRSWLAHKLNGNIVNGKPSQFTDEELKTLRFALNDMSTKLNAMSLAL